jgi:pimeloyl-ACP methyl ester carboxylesterase
MAMIEVRGVELECSVTGDGPPFIWGHGLTSSMASEDAFGLLDFARLAERCRVVRYDARGHGRSQSTPDPDDYAWSELARDQLALADVLGIGTYIAAGASMGCASAIWAAVHDPERITALVLAIPPTAWESRAEQQQAYEAGARLVERGRIDDYVEASMATPPPDPLVPIADLYRDGYAAAMRTADPVRLARLFRGATTADMPPPEVVAGLRQPTLILAWTGDPGHPMSTAERLVELMPNAQLVTASTFTELRAWSDAALDFVSTVPAG